MRFTVKAKLLILFTIIIILGNGTLGIVTFSRAKKALEESVTKNLDTVSLQVQKTLKMSTMQNLPCCIYLQQHLL